MSSFGAVRSRHVRMQETLGRLRDIKHLVGDAGAEHGPRSSTAIVPFERQQFHEALVHVAGEDLEAQISLMRKLGRLASKEARVKEDEELESFRNHVSNEDPESLYGMRLDDLRSKFAEVRTLATGPYVDVYVHRNVSEFVRARVAVMAKKSPV